MAKAKRARRVSPVTERRRARRAARAQCKAEQRRLKTVIPTERQRVAGVVTAIRAAAKQRAAQVLAQASEAIQNERDDVRKRVAGWRKDVKLGRCVDMTAGPEIFDYRFPQKPPHLKRGGQQRLFSIAPVHTGGRIGDPFRVRGQQYSTEKRALAAVLAALKHDQGGIVVLEQWDGSAYVDGPFYGLEGDGKKLRELDPLDPHGFEIGRAQKLPAYGTRIPRTQPPKPDALSPRAPRNEHTEAMIRGAGWKADRGLEVLRNQRNARGRSSKPPASVRPSSRPAPKKKAAKKASAPRSESKLQAAKRALVGQAIYATVADKRGPLPHWQEYVITGLTAETVIAAPVTGSGPNLSRKTSFRLSNGESRRETHDRAVWHVMRAQSLELVKRTIEAVQPGYGAKRSSRPPAPVKRSSRPPPVRASAAPVKRSSRPPPVRTSSAPAAAARSSRPPRASARPAAAAKPKGIGPLRVGVGVYPAHVLPGAEYLGKSIVLEIVEVNARDKRIKVKPRDGHNGDQEWWLGPDDVIPEVRINAASKEGRALLFREAEHVAVYGEPRFGRLEIVGPGSAARYYRGDQGRDVLRDYNGFLSLSEWRSGRSYSLGKSDGTLTVAELLHRLYIATETDSHVRAGEKVPPLLPNVKKSITLGNTRDDRSESIVWDGKYQEGFYRPSTYSGPARPREQLTVEWFGDLPLVAAWNEGKSMQSTRYLGDLRELTLPGLMQRCRGMLQSGRAPTDAMDLYEAHKHLRRR